MTTFVAWCAYAASLTALWLLVIVKPWQKVDPLRCPEDVFKVSDNLSRLRNLATILASRVPAGMINPEAWTCKYAADELESLRAEVARLRLGQPPDVPRGT